MVRMLLSAPGRLEEHIRKGTLVLEELQVLVLDEADRNARNGLSAGCRYHSCGNAERTSDLFIRATYPSGIEQIAQRVMRSRSRLFRGVNADSQTIQSVFCKVGAEVRLRIGLFACCCIIQCGVPHWCSQIPRSLVS